MTPAARRVLVTGAAGRIGRAVLPLLPQDWDVVATDLRDEDGIRALDVTDLEACAAAFAGVDAVVHLAGDPEPDAPWAELLPANVVAVHNVAQAAMTSGVRRLVLASSIQAISARPAGTQSRPSDAPRPANLYGATKAWAEAVGSWVAAASSTTVVALRIGYFHEDTPDADSVSPYERSSWLSPRDAAELLRAAVEAETAGFLVGNGISANRHRSEDLSDTVRQLGYRPQDDAWATLPR